MVRELRKEKQEKTASHDPYVVQGNDAVGLQ
jgi:hypothetical protein